MRIKKRKKEREGLLVKQYRKRSFFLPRHSLRARGTRVWAKEVKEKVSEVARDRGAENARVLRMKGEEGPPLRESLGGKNGRSTPGGGRLCGKPVTVSRERRYKRDPSPLSTKQEPDGFTSFNRGKGGLGGLQTSRTIGGEAVGGSARFRRRITKRDSLAWTAGGLRQFLDIGFRDKREDGT